MLYVFFVVLVLERVPQCRGCYNRPSSAGSNGVICSVNAAAKCQRFYRLYRPL